MMGAFRAHLIIVVGSEFWHRTRAGASSACTWEGLTCGRVSVCDDLCSPLDEEQLLATMLPFLMPTEVSEVSLARLAYASTALQRFPELSNVTADKKITAALETEDADTITELLLAELAEAAEKIDQPLTAKAPCGF
ncbi:hypothetical protein V5799_005751 [Amblyomma americanum]|uniref:Secreted protein n=1 Tax=Amblyomma americanum TaxID=6943 RepID=A0AAQ4DYD0_AMBAM